MFPNYEISLKDAEVDSEQGCQSASPALGMTASGENWFTGVSRFELRELNSGSKCDPEGKRCVQFKHIKFMLSIDILKNVLKQYFIFSLKMLLQNSWCLYNCDMWIMILELIIFKS